MQIGALGDIHGAFDTVARHHERGTPTCRSGCRSATSPATTASTSRPIAPLYWIKGNNEDFDVIAAAIAGMPPAPTLHYLPNGGPHIVGPWRVAGARRHVRAELVPHAGGGAAALARTQGARPRRVKLGKSRDDKRRHFVREEVLACKALTGIDVFLTHEAPRPFYPAGPAGIDAGKTVINDVLAAMQPRLHLFGHHHEFTDSVRQGVRSIGLDVVTKSYLLIDAETFRCERLDT